MSGCPKCSSRRPVERCLLVVRRPEVLMADVSKLASTRSDAARLALARLGAEARMLETREQLLDEWAQRSGRQPDPEVMADMVQRYNL